MAETIKFDRFDNRKPQCIACDEMLADALDETLSEADQSWFDRHIAICTGCSERMADAQRGAAWLEMLKSPRPEPSALLMERILAQTTGNEVLQPVAVAVDRPARVLPFRIPLPSFKAPWLEPRLAMTAAMAFFSVALTLNLTGVKLNQLHASDLNPANLKRTYYEANAQVSRYYNNLRVVRVMESRVDDLREANSEAEPEPQQAPAPEQNAAPQADPKASPQSSPDKDKPEAPKGPGVSRREMPLADPRVLVSDRNVYRKTNIRKVEGGLA